MGLAMYVQALNRSRALSWPLWTVVLVCCGGSLAGCGRDTIVSYKIPKENAAEEALPGPALPEASQPPLDPRDKVPEAGGGLHWKLPTGWKEQPASGMRYASFTAPGTGGTADVSVVVLPGPAGGDLANVNRWRGQIGLEPVDEKGLAAASQRLRTMAGTLLVVDYKGKADAQKKRLIAAILSTGDKTWFFKMLAEEEVAAAAKPSFLEFLQSLHVPHG